MLRDQTVRTLTLLLGLGLVTSGCGDGATSSEQGSAASPYESSTAAATPQASASSPRSAGESPAPSSRPANFADYEQLLNEVTRATNAIGRIYQQSLGTNNDQQLEALLKPLADEYKAHSEALGTLNKMPVPNAAMARQLQEGPLKPLQDAVSFCKDVNTKRLNQPITAGGITPGTLMEAITMGQHLEKFLLHEILPQNPVVSVTEQSPDPDGAGTGFETPQSDGAAATAPDAAPRAAMQAPASPNEAAEFDGRWSVQVDPPASEYLLPDGATFKLSLPGAAAKGRRAASTAPGLAAGAPIVYPRTPSPWVLLGLNEEARQVSEVRNLLTGEKRGEITGLVLPTTTIPSSKALSADGAYFASQPSTQEFAGIWDVDARQAIGRVKIGDWTGGAFLGFGVDNRLVVIDEADFDVVLRVFSIPQGEKEHEIVIGSRARTDSAVLSPGGRYVAIEQSVSFERLVKFFDIIEGRQVGELTMEQDILAMAFHPDGTRFGVFTMRFGDYAITTWDMRNGGDQSDVPIQVTQLELHEAGDFDYPGSKLVFFPEGRRALVSGHFIVSTDDGRKLARLPEKVTYPLGIVGKNQLAVFHGADLLPWPLPPEARAE